MPLSLSPPLPPLHTLSIHIFLTFSPSLSLSFLHILSSISTHHSSTLSYSCELLHFVPLSVLFSATLVNIQGDRLKRDAGDNTTNSHVGHGGGGGETDQSSARSVSAEKAVRVQNPQRVEKCTVKEMVWSTCATPTLLVLGGDGTLLGRLVMLMLRKDKSGRSSTDVAKTDGAGGPSKKPGKKAKAAKRIDKETGSKMGGIEEKEVSYFSTVRPYHCHTYLLVTEGSLQGRDGSLNTTKCSSSSPEGNDGDEYREVAIQHIFMGPEGDLTLIGKYDRNSSMSYSEGVAERGTRSGANTRQSSKGGINRGSLLSCERPTQMRHSLFTLSKAVLLQKVRSTTSSSNDSCGSAAPGGSVVKSSEKRGRRYAHLKCLPCNGIHKMNGSGTSEFCKGDEDDEQETSVEMHVKRYFGLNKHVNCKEITAVSVTAAAMTESRSSPPGMALPGDASMGELMVMLATATGSGEQEVAGGGKKIKKNKDSSIHTDLTSILEYSKLQSDPEFPSSGRSGFKHVLAGDSLLAALHVPPLAVPEEGGGGLSGSGRDEEVSALLDRVRAMKAHTVHVMDSEGGSVLSEGDTTHIITSNSSTDSDTLIQEVGCKSESISFLSSNTSGSRNGISTGRCSLSQHHLLLLVPQCEPDTAPTTPHRISETIVVDLDSLPLYEGGEGVTHVGEYDYDSISVQHLASNVGPTGNAGSYDEHRQQKAHDGGHAHSYLIALARSSTPTRSASASPPPVVVLVVTIIRGGEGERVRMGVVQVVTPPESVSGIKGLYFTPRDFTPYHDGNNDGSSYMLNILYTQRCHSSSLTLLGTSSLFRAVWRAVHGRIMLKEISECLYMPSRYCVRDRESGEKVSKDEDHVEDVTNATALADKDVDKESIYIQLSMFRACLERHTDVVEGFMSNVMTLLQNQQDLLADLNSRVLLLEAAKEKKKSASGSAVKGKGVKSKRK